MILGQVSWLDIFVFLVFLAPQLIAQVGFFPTLFCGLQALPFLLVKLPLSFIYDRFLLSQEYRPPFVRRASWFEDVVIRCVRYAFAYIPASIGRVFFSKWVSLPFLRFRMLRHGYLRSPVYWKEVKEPNFNGIWMIHDQSKRPDIVIEYAHGGGFSMGSSYFYLEFLLAFLSLLKSHPNSPFSNPAILAVEYDLVPDSSYPVQLQQALAGYKYILKITHDASKIVVSGDSAGATLILSLLLYLGSSSSPSPSQDEKPLLNGTREEIKEIPNVKPGMAVLISPWVTLASPQRENTTSDYLDASNLHQYAHQYAGPTPIQDPLISPGDCTDTTWWGDASPLKGYFISFGAEEVFAPEIKSLIHLLEESKVQVEWQEEEGGVHAWPVASLFLCATRGRRIRGLEVMVKQICERMRVS